MEVDQSGVGSPGGEDPANSVVIQGAGQAEPAKEVVSGPDVVAGEDVQPPNPRNRTYSPVQRPTPRTRKRRSKAAPSDSDASASRSRCPSAMAPDNSIRARAFCRLNPRARKSSGFSPASSSGREKRGPGRPRRPWRARTPRRVGRAGETEGQRDLLAGDGVDHALEDGGEPRRLHPAEPPRQRTEAVVAGREPVELREIDAEAEQPLQGRRHGGPRTGAGRLAVHRDCEPGRFGRADLM